MSAIDEIMRNIPMGQLAQRLGVDEGTAAAATQQALPALLGGLQANAQDPAGEASLMGALGGHSAGLVDGGVDLDQVDAGDGEKIVGNIFGGSQGQVLQALGGGGEQSGLMSRLLPLLAPIVMSYLARQLGGGAGGAAGGGGLLGSLLGGAAGGGAGGGGNLAGMLGGMLGGGGSAPGGVLGGEQDGNASVLNALGGLLGGGRR